MEEWNVDGIGVGEGKGYTRDTRGNGSHGTDDLTFTWEGGELGRETSILRGSLGSNGCVLRRGVWMGLVLDGIEEEKVGTGNEGGIHPIPPHSFHDPGFLVHTTTVSRDGSEDRFVSFGRRRSVPHRKSLRGEGSIDAGGGVPIHDLCPRRHRVGRNAGSGGRRGRRRRVERERGKDRDPWRVARYWDVRSIACARSRNVDLGRRIEREERKERSFPTPGRRASLPTSIPSFVRVPSRFRMETSVVRDPGSVRTSNGDRYEQRFSPCGPPHSGRIPLETDPQRMIISRNGGEWGGFAGRCERHSNGFRKREDLSTTMAARIEGERSIHVAGSIQAEPPLGNYERSRWTAVSNKQNKLLSFTSLHRRSLLV